MRYEAGELARRRIATRLMVMAGLAFGAAGVLIAELVFPWASMPAWEWSLLAAAVALWGSGGVFLALQLERGEGAVGWWADRAALLGVSVSHARERAVGRSLDQWLSRPGVALVHSVPVDGVRGEAHHVLGSAGVVWVIEDVAPEPNERTTRRAVTEVMIKVGCIRRVLGGDVEVRGVVLVQDRGGPAVESREAEGGSVWTGGMEAFKTAWERAFELGDVTNDPTGVKAYRIINMAAAVKAQRSVLARVWALGERV